jgi:uncharacterized membrane protein
MNKLTILTFLQDPVRVFIALALVFGVGFALYTPPFQVGDEHDHYFRTYQLTDGVLLGVKLDSCTAGGYMPADLVEMSGEVAGGIPFHPERRVRPAVIRHYLAQPYDDDKRTFQAFANTAVYSPVPYLPQIVAISAGRILGLSGLGLLYLARVLNLFVWTLLVALAIRAMPTGRWLLLLLALAPTSLYQAASCSGDGFTNGLAFLLLGLVMQLAMLGGEAKQRQLWTVLAVGLLLALCKPPSQLALLLLFAVPTRVFGSVRRRWLWVFGIGIACGVVLLGWLAYANTVYVPARKDMPIDPVAQLQYVFAYPWRFFRLTLETYWVNKGEFKVWYIAVLGWIDTYLPLWVYSTYDKLILLFAFLDCEIYAGARRRFSPLLRALLLLAAALGLFATALLLYLSWGAPQDTIIEGILGRYFITFLPMAFLALHLGFMPSWFARRRWWVVFYLLAVYVGAFMALDARFYP